MNVVRLGELELTKFGHEDDPTTHIKADFPFSAATGNTSTALVYVEVEPGDRLASHVDSAEEILLILEGEAEVCVGDELSRVSPEDMVSLPAMVPHSVRNVGVETVRFVSFFSSSTNMATFDRPFGPIDQPPGESPFGERTVLIPPPVALEKA